MVVYVLSRFGDPLMPCRPQKARKLLKEGKARVVRRTPFTIQHLFGSGTNTQEVVAGMDTGSKTLGCAAVTNSKVIYTSEVTLNNGISRKMTRRSRYRRLRRSRKTRYRPARFNNRAASKKEGRLGPSVRSKLDSHLREKQFIESILPVTKWIVETAQFDIHKITNPEVTGRGYQEGPQKDFANVRAYVLHRDGYKCQHRQKDLEHSKVLRVHHIVWRRDGGSDAPSNLITLCKDCHDLLHAGEWSLSTRKRRTSKTKDATHTGIVQARLKKSSWEFEGTFGYLTKLKRQQLGLPKSHANDAIVICLAEGEVVNTPRMVFFKRHVSAGDYRQTKGKHSEVRIPTGKLLGLRRLDLIRTPKGTGFVKGKRSCGRFAITDIFNRAVLDVNIKKDCTRLSARSTTLIMPLLERISGVLT